MKNSIISMFLVLVLSLILVACGGSDDSNGDTASIYGVVTDKATGEVLINAGVKLHKAIGGFNSTTVTGSDGQFEFNGLEPIDSPGVDSYSITVEKTGYFPETISISSLKAGQQVRNDFQLENPCNPNPCGDHQTCIVDYAHRVYNCYCDDGYFVDDYYRECINPCEPNPCENGRCKALSWYDYLCE